MHNEYSETEILNVRNFFNEQVILFKSVQYNYIRAIFLPPNIIIIRISEIMPDYQKFIIFLFWLSERILSSFMSIGAYIISCILFLRCHFNVYENVPFNAYKPNIFYPGLNNLQTSV